MRLVPDVIWLRDLPAAAWVMSSAFVERRWRSRALAAVAWLFFLLTLIPGVLVGGAYWRDRNGLVLVHRRRPLVDGAVLVGVILVAIVILGVLTWVSAWFSLLGLLVVGWLFAGAVIAIICNGVGSALSPVGAETPRGQRWIVAGLAQRPGTRMTAVLLARDLVRRLPSGAVLVAVAADDDLLRRYLRLGFTEGKRRRVYLQMS